MVVLRQSCSKVRQLQAVAIMPPKRRLDSTENRTLHLSALARDERRLHKEANATEFYFGRMLAERMMSYAEVPQVQVSERVRDVIKAVPEGNWFLSLAT